MNEQREVFLITGSSGLLGHSLSHHFGAKNHRIVGFDEAGPPYPAPNTDVLFCDLTSDESVQKTFFIVRTVYGGRIKSVFHLAAYYSFSGKDSHLYKDLTVDGTKRMLRELQSFDVGQFIFSSSMLVYKPNAKGEKLTEESQVAPTWAYPQSKVDTEKLMKETHGKIPVVVLRIAGVYSDICQSIPIAHQIQRIYERRVEGHLYSGNVDVKQAYVHLEDVALAFEACVNNADKLSDFEVFNIGEEDAMCYDDMQRAIARELFDESWPTVEVPKPIAKAGAFIEDVLPMQDSFVKPWMVDRADDNYELNIDKARRLLGWEPKHSLRETLPKMLEGLKLDPEKWYKINKLHLPHGSYFAPAAEEPATGHQVTGPVSSQPQISGAAAESSGNLPAIEGYSPSQVPLLAPPSDKPERPDQVA
jgi:nucleoside-diphosphate-sugar epimerase